MSAVKLILALSVIAAAVIILQAREEVEVDHVGCLFSSEVCRKDEWCFDDYAFGRCQKYNKEGDEMYRFNFRREALQMLQMEMARLYALGYRWKHEYTQCILQTMLDSIRQAADYNEEACAEFADQDLDGALKAFVGDDEEKNLKPSLVARVKFTPSVEDPQSDFADEFYIPLLDLVPEEVEGIRENVIKGEDLEEANSDYPLRKLFLDKTGRPKKNDYSQHQRVPGVFPINSFLADSQDTNTGHFSQQYNTPDNFRLGIEAKDEAADAVQSFRRNYNTPDNFRLGVETKDLNDDEDGYGEPQNEESRFMEDLREDVFASPEGRELIYDSYRERLGNEANENSYPINMETPDLYDPYRAEDKLSRNLELLAEEAGPALQDSRVFTEGGVVRLPEDQSDFDQFVRDYNAGVGWGFKRRERLDVKKPGPNYNLNNFAFKTNDNQPAAVEKQPIAAHIEATKLENKGKDELKTTVKMPSVAERTLPPPLPTLEKVLSIIKKGVGSPKGSPNLRKNSSNTEDTQDDVAYVKFKNSVGEWTDAMTFLRNAAKLMDVDPNSFSHLRVSDTEIFFKVDRTKSIISAEDVAKKIDGLKDKLKAFGVEVVSAGKADKPKYQGQVTVVEAANPIGTEELVSFLLCGVIAAIAIGGAAFFFVRRHSHTKEKLTGLKQPDSEASKDYQELCRARMASKSAQDKPESVIGRLSSTSKEAEANQSPSSRSSTSSWSEEPALTNMDISTGHMVLSYMEDHLKNKDRLEQEWIALCAYEAEPCATTIATAEHNLKKNRYPDVLPYDHSRVQLNQLLNISGSDYVNASTINDHDPRNPAYIATQGPLENTAADLWQMLWEQGSVVMVMLTRLSENGNAMCHRYWPEEGSQIYHLYEVHLVSEHIWCDDYLVRSFYLKNLKTGETRTVTQFHFLSWPENGVPLSTKALLEFRRKVNKSYRGRSCPIVVHCSDGVGRTGTYCLIDMVLNRMAKGAKEIDIAATLEHIRDQRPNMVKTKQQFEFVLMAVAEEVHAILKALPATHSPPPVAKEKE